MYVVTQHVHMVKGKYLDLWYSWRMGNGFLFGHVHVIIKLSSQKENLDFIIVFANGFVDTYANEFILPYYLCFIFLRNTFCILSYSDVQPKGKNERDLRVKY